MNNPAEPTGFRGGDPVHPDQAKSEFYALSMWFTAIRNEILNLAHRPAEELPPDVKNRISRFVVEIKRFAVQLGAIECDEIEQKVIDHAVRIVSIYADTFEKYESHFSRDTFHDTFNALEPIADIFISTLHLLGLSRGDPLELEETFLNAKGKFGTAEGKAFSVDPLIAELEDAFTIVSKSWNTDSRKFIISSATWYALLDAGKKTGDVIEVIEAGTAHSWDEYDLYGLFKFTKFNLAVVLTIVRRDMKLPHSAFYSEQTRSLTDERDIEESQMFEKFEPLIHFSDAVNLLKLAKRVADIRKRYPV